VRVRALIALKADFPLPVLLQVAGLAPRYDNAVMENFFGHLKEELFHHVRFLSTPTERLRLRCTIPSPLSWRPRTAKSVQLGQCRHMTERQYRCKCRNRAQQEQNRTEHRKMHEPDRTRQHPDATGDGGATLTAGSGSRSAGWIRPETGVHPV
jgi:hypothetical protein